MTYTRSKMTFTSTFNTFNDFLPPLKKIECLWNDWNFCYGLIITTPSEFCLPHEMGRHIVFSSVVCLSVRLSVCPSRFGVRSIYFEPLVGFTNLHKCHLWWDNVQCQCLTKVGSRSRSQSKIKHCMTLFRVRSILFEPLVAVCELVYKPKARVE